MPIPFFLAAGAAIAGVTGIFKGGQAISNNNKAKEYIEDAQRKYDRAKSALDEQRNITSADLEVLGKTKLNAWSNDIGQFVEYFKKFKNVDINGNVNLNEKLKLQIDNTGNFKNMEVASLKATEVVKAGVTSLGAGALAGIASYGGAMMFASASTGTAIATLSGAAATNATLAWFGGGSLAAGGLGMAGGTAVLGGIVAGPVLAVAGFIMAAKSEENLANAKKTYSEAKLAAEKMDTMTDFMSKVSAISENYNNFIIEFSARFAPVLSNLKNIYSISKSEQENTLLNKIKKLFGVEIKVDYKKLTIEQQKALQLSWLMAQIQYAVLAAPILTQDGNIDTNVQKTLDGAKESSQKLLGTGC